MKLSAIYSYLSASCGESDCAQITHSDLTLQLQILLIWFACYILRPTPRHAPSDVGKCSHMIMTVLQPNLCMSRPFWLLGPRESKTRVIRRVVSPKTRLLGLFWPPQNRLLLDSLGDRGSTWRCLRIFSVKSPKSQGSSQMKLKKPEIAWSSKRATEGWKAPYKNARVGVLGEDVSKSLR